MSTGEPPGEDRGNLGPPPIPFRIGRDQLPQLRGVRWLILLVGLFVLFIVASVGKGIYTDYLWFDGLGYSSVYSKEIFTKTWLFFVGGLLFLAVAGLNLWLARRLAPVGLEESFIAEIEPATLKRIVTIGLIAGSLFLAIVFGSVASSEWATFLRFANRTDFGLADPAFHLDVGFYIFTLPALWSALNWLTGVTVITVLGVVGVYLFTFSLQNFEMRLSRAVKGHVGGLLIVLLLVFGFRYLLDIWSLNVEKHGFVTGASYTDIHARVPGFIIIMVFAAVAAAGILWSVFRRSLLAAAAGGVAWIAAAIVMLGIYPGVLQRVTVDPNELAKEQPYIERNIAMTRSAFSLEGVEQQPFKADSAVSRDLLTQDQATINNIRLWDPRVILDTYKQQQEIQPFYVFDDVDVDRYTIADTNTEVTLSARELAQSSLPLNARSWVNVHLQYTHGYGAVMNAVNKLDAFGLPNYNLLNIPPQGEPAIVEPRIYYGNETKEYVVVGAKQQEIDFVDPQGNSQQTRYSGKGGVAVGSFFRKLIYAWEFGDTNLLISGQMTGDSRLLYRREIGGRITHIAPFLTLDKDPYLVVSEGKLVWIQDAYTTSTNFPYSEASSSGINYIRNSVKVVVDAYNGDVTFYLTTDNDPISRSYQKIFPSLFKPLSEMPEALRGHLRYPEDLFKLQADIYRTYHMTDPRVFYNKEDLWATPKEGAAGNATEVVPYYLIMRLPGEPKEEFVLIRPFTPANKPNAISLMAARMDAPNYGKLAVYRFPSGRQIPGPAQVESSIDAQPEISQRFTLLNQKGSKVQRGNLLLIPINESYIYVEPVYLAADQNPKPAVIAVIVYAGDKTFMEPALNQGLAVALGEAPATYTFGTVAATAATQGGAPGRATPIPSTSTPGAALPTLAPAPPGVAVTATGTTIPDLVREASDADARAQDRLRQGDFAGYGQQEARLRAALDRLNQLLVQQTASPTPTR